MRYSMKYIALLAPWGKMNLETAALPSCSWLLDMWVAMALPLYSLPCQPSELGAEDSAVKTGSKHCREWPQIKT